MKQLMAAAMVGIAAFGLVSCSGGIEASNATSDLSAVDGGSVVEDNLATDNTAFNESVIGNAAEANGVDTDATGTLDNATDVTTNAL